LEEVYIGSDVVRADDVHTVHRLIPAMYGFCEP